MRVKTNAAEPYAVQEKWKTKDDHADPKHTRLPRQGVKDRAGSKSKSRVKKENPMARKRSRYGRLAMLDGGISVPGPGGAVKMFMLRLDTHIDPDVSLPNEQATSSWLSNAPLE
jgi:hypothetical protein